MVREIDPWLRKEIGLGGRGPEFSHGGINKKTNNHLLMHMDWEEMLELSPIRNRINSINLSYTARTCIVRNFPPPLPTYTSTEAVTVSWVLFSSFLYKAKKTFFLFCLTKRDKRTSSY